MWHGISKNDLHVQSKLWLHIINLLINMKCKVILLIKKCKSYIDRSLCQGFNTVLMPICMFYISKVSATDGCIMPISDIAGYRGEHIPSDKQSNGLARLRRFAWIGHKKSRFGFWQETAKFGKDKNNVIKSINKHTKWSAVLYLSQTVRFVAILILGVDLANRACNFVHKATNSHHIHMLDLAILLIGDSQET